MPYAADRLVQNARMNWKPEGNHTITPNLVVDGGQDALDFYVRAFGAEVVTRLTMGDKLMHAELSIGDSTFTLSDEFPRLRLRGTERG